MHNCFARACCFPAYAQADGQTLTVRTSGQLALDLRALPRGATICATLHDEQLDCPQLLAFTLISLLSL
jgi:hypothetical protein